MNQRMDHHYEAVADADGSWTVGEFVGKGAVAVASGFTRREALHQAVRLNRDVLREERRLRHEQPRVAAPSNR